MGATPSTATPSLAAPSHAHSHVVNHDKRNIVHDHRLGMNHNMAKLQVAKKNPEQLIDRKSLGNDWNGFLSTSPFSYANLDCRLVFVISLFLFRMTFYARFSIPKQ